MSSHQQARSARLDVPTNGLQAQASPEQTRLQALLDSFSGELDAYQPECPSQPFHAANWQHLVEAATILPHLAPDCQQLIEQRLGYLPPHHTRHSQEAFLRALLQQRRTGQLSAEDFEMQVDHCVKNLRNLDMQPPLREVNAQAAEACYENYLPAYSGQARARLMRFLGEAPNLAHSLVVELWLRQVLAQDGYGLPETETALDRKAVMLVRYRKALATHGRAVANDLPLPGRVSF